MLTKRKKEKTKRMEKREKIVKAENKNEPKRKTKFANMKKEERNISPMKIIQILNIVTRARYHATPTTFLSLYY